MLTLKLENRNQSIFQHRPFVNASIVCVCVLEVNVIMWFKEIFCLDSLIFFSCWLYFIAQWCIQMLLVKKWLMISDYIDKLLNEITVEMERESNTQESVCWLLCEWKLLAHQTPHMSVLSGPSRTLKPGLWGRFVDALIWIQIPPSKQAQMAN